MTTDKFVVEPTWTDKDSKVERFRELYERNDFLTAYSQHTDLRMEDDPKWAIGRGDEWESHGLLQLDFMIACGMLPASRLLDIGCGPGRAARRFVPYLDRGHYTGIDISAKCLEHARALSVTEGWAEREPRFLINADMDLADEFDFIWAHSVFTHLPSEQIEVMVANVPQILAEHGEFLFTYKQGKVPERTGLKQWRYPFAFFEAVAQRNGLVAKPLDMIWPASQRTGCITRCR